ncbi:MAG: RluA family pseudouridine synthase [Deltaproteobacteria bacterium]|nr:RluA family pseudouridine synthase [Deltaproteobacteria bacterium]MBZ0220225.1 RluA family pseudouridine synthase [Deltaproteobacteria bacterium]
MEKKRIFTVTPAESRQRVDVFLSSMMPEVTRSRMKALSDEGRVLVNGKPAKAGHKVRENDQVEVSLPEPPPGYPEPEEIPLDILYEDADIIVVNKPAGMAVHPGAGRISGTLVNALLFHAGGPQGLAPTGAPVRPGIVHRLDRDTTGSLAVAKNDRSYLSLARQLKERSARRKYVALVWGSFKDDEGSIDLAIGRDSVQRKKISTRARVKRRAVTRYRVLKRFPLMTLLELKLETGRTHQIRVHLNAVHHPVVGDQVYGKRAIPPALPKAAADVLKGVKRQMLHAWSLGIEHPATGEDMEFRAPMPPDMQRLLNALEKESEPECGHLTA